MAPFRHNFFGIVLHFHNFWVKMVENKEKKFSKQLASEVIIVQLFFKILAITPTKDSHKEFDNQNIKTLKMLHTIGLVPKRRRIQFPGATTWRLCAKAPLLFLYLINIIMSYYIFIFILAGSNIY